MRLVTLAPRHQESTGNLQRETNLLTVGLLYVEPHYAMRSSRWWNSCHRYRWNIKHVREAGVTLDSRGARRWTSRSANLGWACFPAFSFRRIGRGSYGQPLWNTKPRHTNSIVCHPVVDIEAVECA